MTLAPLRERIRGLLNADKMIGGDVGMTCDFITTTQPENRDQVLTELNAMFRAGIVDTNRHGYGHPVKWILIK